MGIVNSLYLGSANWITDGKGKPIQYIHYALYGELFANQQVAWYDERYKFTGKERDAETGYDFFGHGFCGNTSGVADENSRYGYDDHRLTHQPRVIFDYKNNRHTQLAWDANGNMVCDAARGISAIRYNRLNLPDTIQFVNGGQVINFYDATGQKYKSITYTNIASVIPQQYDFAHYSFETDSLNYHVTEYAGNIELHKIKDTALTTFRRIHNTIGYYDTSDSTYFHYIKDHLGNICAVVNSTADTVVQRTMYYASVFQWRKVQDAMHSHTCTTGRSLLRYMAGIPTIMVSVDTMQLSVVSHPLTH